MSPFSLLTVLLYRKKTLSPFHTKVHPVHSAFTSSVMDNQESVRLGIEYFLPILAANSSKLENTFNFLKDLGMNLFFS